MNPKKPFFRNSEVQFWIIILFLSFFAFGCNDHSGNLSAKRSDDGFRYQMQKYLMRSDTVILPIIDKATIVHSLGYNQGNQIIEAVSELLGTGRNISNTGSNLSVLAFSIPDSVTAWSYYIGVNQAGIQAYSNAANNFINAATSYNSEPVTALALGLFSYLTTVQSGENVQYWIVDEENRDLLLQKQEFESIISGDVINDFGRLTDPLKGNYFLCMANDNPLNAIEVIVKISAVRIQNYYGTHRVRVKNYR